MSLSPAFSSSEVNVKARVSLPSKAFRDALDKYQSHRFCEVTDAAQSRVSTGGYVGYVGYKYTRWILIRIYALS